MFLSLVFSHLLVSLAFEVITGCAFVECKPNAVRKWLKSHRIRLIRYRGFRGIRECRVSIYGWKPEQSAKQLLA
jgi:hypothetical protein